MNGLQKAIIEVIRSMAGLTGRSVDVSSPKYSEEFRCYYFAVGLPWAGIIGAVFPSSANFWDEEGLDIRFERIDFESDAEMCDAVTASLAKALVH
jgi:hypothetical protein